MNESAPRTVRVEQPSSATLYDLVTQIGEGGMGVVFRARDRSTGETVAVKLLKREADAVRFAREVSALARLSHPNIVRYAGHGITEDGTQFVAMEWLEGESLEAALRARELPLRRALEIARDVASAMAHAHEEGIVHRDLKPSNVFLSTNGVKVLDFGVARFIDESGLTLTGQVVGTPSYMAPEQARGERNVGPSADLFSLGCILYRCIARESPFGAPDVLAVLNRLATHVPPRLPGVPRGVADLVALLLLKDPSARPPSAREVERSLATLLETDLQPERAAPFEPTLASAPPPKRRSRLPFVLAAGAFCVGATAWVAYARHRHVPDAPLGAPRVAGDRACRTWGTEMARRQQSNGAFTGEAHRDPTGWDTAQELVALTYAKDCASISTNTLRSAADALAKMQTPEGWLGPDRVGRGTISVAADAWAALALSRAAIDDASWKDAAASARALLVSKQRADGSFGYQSMTDPPDTYSTLIAAWALATGDAAAAPCQRAFTWLRTSFGTPGSELRRVAGLEEQYLWLASTQKDEAVIATGAADVVARCGLDSRTHACTRPVYDDGEIAIGTGKLVTLWHAWVGAAAYALASYASLPADVRKDLDAIARWDASTLEASMDALAALPEYKLAEYLVGTSALATPR